MSNTLNTLTIAQLKQAVAIKERLAKLEKKLAAILGTSVATSVPGKKKGTLSAAGRARIAAAQKKRWAKIKGQTQTAPTVVAAKPTKKKFTMSASAKAAISKAAKARWAKIKAAEKA